MTGSSRAVLVTGSNGFIGTHLIEALSEDNQLTPVAAVRSPEKTSLNAPGSRVLGNLEDYEQLDTATLQGIQVVVHAAARAHILSESRSSTNPFQKANVDATLSLARTAARAGVTRFIFISSIGVNGSYSKEPFTVDSTPAPDEPYAWSKLEAEKGLRKIQEETGMDVVIIRPTLVYGPSAPGNFGLLARVMKTGLPLPLDGIHNARSFVSVWNLVDLIKTCIEHPSAANATLLVRDGEDIATSELLRKMAVAQGHTPRLFWVPRGLLKAGATLLGKRQMYDRLFDSLQVDDTATRKMLDWTPPLLLDEGIQLTFSSE